VYADEVSIAGEQMVRAGGPTYGAWAFLHRMRPEMSAKTAHPHQRRHD
jgi:hypothetical protein